MDYIGIDTQGLLFQVTQDNLFLGTLEPSTEKQMGWTHDLSGFISKFLAMVHRNRAVWVSFHLDAETKPYPLLAFLRLNFPGNYCCVHSIFPWWAALSL